MDLKGVTGLIPTEAFCCIVVVPLLDCMIQIVVIVPVLAELLFTVFLTLFSTLHLFRHCCRRLIGEVIQSQRRPLLGPSPG